MSNEPPPNSPEGSDQPESQGQPNPPEQPPLVAPSGPNPFSEPTSPFENSPFEKGAKIDESSETATFSLLHIIFWTAGIGLAMSIDPAAFMPPGQMDDDAKRMMNLYTGYTRAITGISMGPLLGMLPFWFIYRRKGIQFPYHPGHWLILHYGVSFLVNVIANWIQRALNLGLQELNPEDLNAMFAGMAPMYIGNAVSLLAGSVIAWLAFVDLKRDRPIWRFSFGMLGLQSILGAIGCIVTVVGIYGNEAVFWVGMMSTGVVTGCVAWLYFLLVFVAVVLDLAEKNRRDWLHWMPFFILIFAIAASAVAMVIAMVAMA